MFPWLRLGSFWVQWYHIFIGMGVLASAITVSVLARREKLSIWKYLVATILVFSVGYLGAKILNVIVIWNKIEHTPIGIWNALGRGMYWYGGPLLGLPATIIFAKLLKLPVGTTTDFGGLCLAIGQAFGRIGCFAAGCCYGKPTDSIFGIRFPNVLRKEYVNIPIHPAPLYEAIMLIGLYLFLLWFYKRREFPGQVFLLYLIFAPIIRVYSELFRDDRRGTVFYGIMSSTEMMSLFILTFAVIAHILFSRKYAKQP